MSQILIDRDLLQRMLDRFFELDADVRAHRWIVTQAGVKNPSVWARYGDEHQKRAAEELAQMGGLPERLRETLVSEDDDAFRRTLYDQFPGR
jgi:hypothetical protein